MNLWVKLRGGVYIQSHSFLSREKKGCLKDVCGAQDSAADELVESQSPKRAAQHRAGQGRHAAGAPRTGAALAKSPC